MRTIYHPTLSNVTLEVSKEDEGDWKAAGWRFTPIPEAKAEELSAPVEGDE